MPDILFVSKVDFWIASVLWLGSLSLILIPLWEWRWGKSDSRMRNILLMAILLPFAALMLMPFFGTKYTLTDSQLHVDSGLSTQKIELTDITYITPTRSMSSAPALSLDRLKIAYRNQEILISPKDKSHFYQEIQARNPKIVIDEVSE